MSYSWIMWYLYRYQISFLTSTSSSIYTFRFVNHAPFDFPSFLAVRVCLHSNLSSLQANSRCLYVCRPQNIWCLIHFDSHSVSVLQRLLFIRVEFIHSFGTHFHQQPMLFDLKIILMTAENGMQLKGSQTLNARSIMMTEIKEQFDESGGSFMKSIFFAILTIMKVTFILICDGVYQLKLNDVGCCCFL